MDLSHIRDQRTIDTMKKTVPSAGKLMATAFWDTRGAFDYIFKDGKNNYRSLLSRFSGPIQCRLEESATTFGEDKSSLPPR